MTLSIFDHFIVRLDFWDAVLLILFAMLFLWAILYLSFDWLRERFKR